MLQMIFLIIGICILLLVFAFIFKQHARKILWTSAIVMTVGTLLLVGTGIVNPISEDSTGSVEFWGTIITLITGALMAVTAQMLHKTDDKQACIKSNQHVSLADVLDTELARKVFAKAIENGFMEEDGSHYKWKDTKVLLAYMCGRIYCGDKPEYYKIDQKVFWKFGKTGIFPDTELSNLFNISDLGQSRSNRKEMGVPLKSKEIDIFFD